MNCHTYISNTNSRNSASKLSLQIPIRYELIQVCGSEKAKLGYELLLVYDYHTVAVSQMVVWLG